MENKISWYRLGVILLALALAFIGVQALDWSLSASAGTTTSSQAALVALPHSPSAPPDTQNIGTWGTSIISPGVYRLTQDLMGTDGIAITVNTNTVTILGNGYTIRGDGVQETSSISRETGVYISSRSNVRVTGVAFRGLDRGIAGLNTNPVRDLFFEFNTFDLLGASIQWVNASSARNVSIKNNSFDSGYDWGIDWYNPSGTSESVSVQYNRFTNINAGYGYGIDISNMGSAQNIFISHDTFSGNKRDVALHHDGDTVGGLTVSNNHFQNSGQSVYIANHGMPLSGVTIDGNTFLGNTYPGTPYPGFPQGHINLYGGGSAIRIQHNTIQSGTNMSGIQIAGIDMGHQPFPLYDVILTNNRIENLTGSDGTGKAAGVHFFNYGDTTGTGLVQTGLASLAVPAVVTPTVRNNSFINNSGPGVSYTMGISNPLPYIDARENWWGDPEGPNGPNGDGVSDNVLFDPWLPKPPAEYAVYLPLVLRSH